MRFFFIVTTLFLLCSCTGTSKLPSSKEQSQTDQVKSLPQPEQQLPDALPQHIQELMDQFEKTKGLKSPKREQEQLRIASKLLKEQSLSEAKDRLLQIDSSSLSLSWQTHHKILVAQYYLHTEQVDRAIATLVKVEPQLDRLSKDQQLYVHNLLALLYVKTNQQALEMEQRLWLSSLLPDPEKSANNQRLWQYLLTQDPKAMTHQQSRLFLGWSKLVSLYNEFKDTPAFAQELHLWRGEFPEHPGSALFPDIPNMAATYFPKDPKEIVVFLPLSGKMAFAGNAVSEGLSRSLERYQASSPKPNIHFIDTEQGDIVVLYEQAKARFKPDLIIGPLQKEVAKKLLLASVAEPILILNTLEERDKNPRVMQFSVAPDDEVTLILRHMKQRNLNNVVLLSDQSTLGSRIASSFVSKAAQIGISIIPARIGDPNTLSVQLNSLLQINDSMDRKKELATLLDSKLKFEPRRRQDIGALFLALDLTIAKQIKPLLRFYYAGDLPVYGTSHLYDSDQTQETNQDLEDIIFPAYPWMLDKGLSEQSNDTSQQRSYLALFSFGFDALRLALKLHQSQDLHHSGLSGDLSLTGDGNIQRQMPLAQFKGGRISRYEEK